MTNRDKFWTAVFDLTATKGEAFAYAGRIFQRMKSSGMTKAWRLTEMTDEEFHEAYALTNEMSLRSSKNQ